MVWFPAWVKCLDLSTVNTFQCDHLLGRACRFKVFCFKGYFLPFLFWAEDNLKVFQDEGIYIPRNKTKRFCNGICELHLPWGTYHKVQGVFFIVSFWQLWIGKWTYWYCHWELPFTSSDTGGKEKGTSLCEHTQRIPWIHFIWNSRGTKQLKQLLLLFLIGKRGREQSLEKKIRRNAWWEREGEKRKDEGKLAGVYAERRDK